MARMMSLRKSGLHRVKRLSPRTPHQRTPSSSPTGRKCVTARCATSTAAVLDSEKPMMACAQTPFLFRLEGGGASERRMGLGENVVTQNGMPLLPAEPEGVASYRTSEHHSPIGAQLADICTSKGNARSRWGRRSLRLHHAQRVAQKYLSLRGSEYAPPATKHWHPPSGGSLT